MAIPKLSRKAAKIFAEYKVPIDPGFDWALEVEGAKSEGDLSPELRAFLAEPYFINPKPKDLEKHLPGQHDQSTHGGRKSYSSIDDLVKDGLDLQETVEELGDYSASDGNVAMRVLLERAGKGGKPEIVNSVDDLDGDPIYRGAADVTNDSFKTNEYDRIGVGQYGDGYYFSDNKITAEDYAARAGRDKTYGDNNPDVMVASWKKDAKIYAVGESMNWIDASTAAQNKAIDKLNVNTRASDDQDAIYNLFYSDYGNAFVTDLILQGYDGMSIKIGLTENYTVVFNREAMQVVGN